MALKFTIGKKLGLGFGSIILFIVIVFVLTFNSFTTSKRINDEITTIYNPSVAELEELRFYIVRSRLLIITWVNTPKADAPDKKKLSILWKKEVAYVKSTIGNLKQYWSAQDQASIETIFTDVEELREMHEEVKMTLQDFDSYNDPTNRLMSEFRLEEDGDIYEKSREVIFLLEDLISHQKQEAQEITDKMNTSQKSLKLLILIFMIALPIIGLLIAFSTTRSIVSPVNRLRKILLNLSKGIYPDSEIRAKDDEIGEMTNALNRLVLSSRGTKDFASELGAGNFDANYELLSEEDSLGIALLKMRDDLAENERELEEKSKAANR